MMKYFKFYTTNICIYLIAAIALFVQGCASSITKTYKAPYSSIELELTKHLNIKSITSDVEGGLTYESIGYPKLHLYIANTPGFLDDKGKLFKPTYEIIDYTPGKKLVIKRLNYYNIFSSGSIGLLFNIEGVAADSTSVEVDFFDNSYVMGVIPIISSGKKEEEYIHSLFFKKYEVIQPQ